MFKKSFFALAILIILLVIAGCKGTRTVKVVVANAGIWYVEINEDDGITTRTGYSTESFDLGDNEANVMVAAWRITNTADLLEDLSVSIVEQYDNGFLYTARSETKASITNTYVNMPYCGTAPATETQSKAYRMSNPLAIATVTYDFTVK